MRRASISLHLAATAKGKPKRTCSVLHLGLLFLAERGQYGIGTSLNILKPLHILHLQSIPPLLYSCRIGTGRRIGSKRTIGNTNVHIEKMLGKIAFDSNPTTLGRLRHVGWISNRQATRRTRLILFSQLSFKHPNLKILVLICKGLKLLNQKLTNVWISLLGSSPLEKRLRKMGCNRDDVCHIPWLNYQYPSASWTHELLTKVLLPTWLNLTAENNCRNSTCRQMAKVKVAPASKA